MSSPLNIYFKLSSMGGLNLLSNLFHSFNQICALALSRNLQVIGSINSICSIARETEFLIG